MPETEGSRARTGTKPIAPVMRTVTVSKPLEEAFRIFTEEVGAWWPLETHSRAQSEARPGVKAETVVLERRLGGRMYEVMSDGTEAAWGELLEWDPPHRMVLAWHPARHLTEVEIRFSPQGSGTRVDLEHRGWERLGDEAMETRQEYVNGWPRILARYEEGTRAAP